MRVLEHSDGHLKRAASALAGGAALFCATAAQAHVSERALVLLLPTDIYIRSGVIAVALTIALLFLVPPPLFRALYRAVPMLPAPRLRVSTVFSLISTTLLFLAIYAGFSGSRDPLLNPLPLLIWTLWWMLMPVLSALFGNVWGGMNPWSGLYGILRLKPLLKLTPSPWIAPFILVLFGLFVVTDIAPDDPDRLAFITLCYWGFTFFMMLLFGPSWLRAGEPFSIYFAQIAKLSPIYATSKIEIAAPGARLVRAEPSLALAVLIIIALGLGSFDGFNETFFWLGLIGVNPLEFPGRSAVVFPNGFGVLGGMCLLGCVVAACTWVGLKMVGAADQFRALFPRLTLSLLPIALGYHIAHYLTSFMVGIQYVRNALSDPMSTGQDLFGIGQAYVTTSFFNVPSTVETIWLTQASAIVIGHILAILMSHAIALEALKEHRRATISQLPVAAFMVAYTFFGLWILAQPTGA